MTTYNTDSTDSWHNIFVAFGISVLLAAILGAIHIWMLVFPAFSQEAISIVAVLAGVLPFIPLYRSCSFYQDQTTFRILE